MVGLASDLLLETTNNQEIDYYPDIIPLSSLINVESIEYKLQNFIGQSVVGEVVDLSLEINQQKKHNSLYEAICNYSSKIENDQSQMMIMQTIRKDLIERSIKSGHISAKITADIVDGEIVQYGQSYQDIYSNSLKYCSTDSPLFELTKAETKNYLRIKTLLEDNILDDYYFVVVSRPIDDLSDKQLDSLGYFVDTMTVSLQVTKVEGNQIITQSAFVAGRDSPDSPRRDKKTVEDMASSLGLDYEGLSAEEVIDRPFLIHKNIIPGGLIDIVKIYDQQLESSFYGKKTDNHKKDYFIHQQDCANREKQLEPLVDKVFKSLVEDHNIKDEVSATKILGMKSQEFLVAASIADKEIDLNIFGWQAATYLESARLASINNDYEATNRLLLSAQKTARTYVCPISLTGEDNKPNNGLFVEEDNVDDNIPEIIKCIKCGNFASKKTIIKEKSWRCPHCRYEVETCSGKVIHNSTKDDC